MHARMHSFGCCRPLHVDWKQDAIVTTKVVAFCLPQKRETAPLAVLVGFGGQTVTHGIRVRAVGAPFLGRGLPLALAAVC